MVYASLPFFGQRSAPFWFGLRRLARIAPLYWLVTGFVVVELLRRKADLSWPMVWASFLFVPYPRPGGEMWPVLAVGWTLNMEMFFYLIFGLALLLPRRTAIASVTVLFSLLAGARLLPIQMPVWLEFLSRPVILEFCFGMAIAHWYVGHHRLSRWTAVIFMAIACAWLPASGLLPSAFTWRVLVWGVPAALVVAAILSLEGKLRGPISRALSRLGDASYSLYLVHLPVMTFLVLKLPRWIDPKSAPWLSILLLTIVPIVVAFAVYAVIERPITARLQAAIRARSRKKHVEVAKAERRESTTGARAIASTLKYPA
jgi:peptidoglycan/LPS O-acetylase OafA/YrhL